MSLQDLKRFFVNQDRTKRLREIQMQRANQAKLKEDARCLHQALTENTDAICEAILVAVKNEKGERHAPISNLHPSIQRFFGVESHEGLPPFRQWLKDCGLDERIEAGCPDYSVPCIYWH